MAHVGGAHVDPVAARAAAVSPDFTAKLTLALREGMRNKGVPNADSLNPRPFQVIVNDLLLQQNADVMHVVATSQGKTETYLIGVRQWRARQRAGPVIVFSPLNALIRDQLERIKAFGLRAYVFGGVDAFGVGHQQQTFKALTSNLVDVLFLTPDMVLYAHKNPKCLLNEVPQLSANYQPHEDDKWTFVPLLVIDEIHVVEESSELYLPGWKFVWSVIKQRPWFVNARKLGLTATLSQATLNSVHSLVPGSAT